MSKHMDELHEEALTVADRMLKCEYRLIEILQSVEACKGYRETKYDCDSLYEYAGKYLKLSPSVTSNIITVARKAIEVPEIKHAIKERKLSVSTARKLTPVITKENQSEWLIKAQTLTKEKLEKEVAIANPKVAVREQMNYVTGERLKLTIGISEEFQKKVKRAQDIESQRTGNHSSIEEALEAALDTYLEKKDPIEKAKRVIAKNNVHTKQVANAAASVLGHAMGNGRQRIVNQTRHELMLKDQGQCTGLGRDGTRCTNRRWLQVHHIKPVSQGGGNELSNLTTLCFYHHRREHPEHT